jgi:hypothetical protein
VNGLTDTIALLIVNTGSAGIILYMKHLSYVLHERCKRKKDIKEERLEKSTIERRKDIAREMKKEQKERRKCGIIKREIKT